MTAIATVRLMGVAAAAAIMLTWAPPAKPVIAAPARAEAQAGALADPPST